MSAIIESPRQPQQRASKGRVNWEKYGWIYMRASGVLLIILIFGHLFVNLVQGDGIKAIDFAFVAGKYATPFWQIWDVLMLWLAMIHGSNGMRTIVNDYASNPTIRRILLGALFVAAVVLIVLGTLVVFTFDPCSTLIPADQALSFCPVP
ncbi:succinate dehydrogenase [Subtercola boreus]|uniref:Succinate dehydrogenase n=1 Tax=Subtercola boreus TaxID=120213 RepID=A0A3E0VGA0_9MICO|nr:succinate dehydrogenase hydrophobic membrane anchor subunit [Subtercola boreus]RFA08390.1 succinate dehydrogenase [Subtercola boreus]TQL54699.1 succinate dehydrogenase subunit D [Subtercola boreus]